MSDRIRVLVVDDSVVIRRLLSDILSADPEIEVVGTAANAAVAMARLKQGLPDVVTLDVEMPDVDGLALLEQIRVLAPRLPVIMFSALTQRAAATTLDALARGASDYVTKPSGAGSREAAQEHVRSQLLPKLKALGRRSSPGRATPSRAVSPPRVVSAMPLEVVAIGASTGGPNALSTVFAQLPASFAAPIVLVQHMPPLFTKLLADRLSTLGGVRVREACDGDVLAPGLALVAPGDHHLKLVRDGNVVRAVLEDGPQENSCRPAVDVLFRSVAATFGPRALGVVLTGMGQDGLKGAQALVAAGSRVLAQDEATSVVWGMPGYVVRSGVADAVLPIEAVGAEIVARVMSRQARAATGASEVAHAGH